MTVLGEYYNFEFFVPPGPGQLGAPGASLTTTVEPFVPITPETTGESSYPTESEPRIVSSVPAFPAFPETTSSGSESATTTSTTTTAPCVDNDALLRKFALEVGIPQITSCEVAHSLGGCTHPDKLIGQRVCVRVAGGDPLNSEVIYYFGYMRQSRRLDACAKACDVKFADKCYGFSLVGGEGTCKVYLEPIMPGTSVQGKGECYQKLSLPTSHGGRGGSGPAAPTPRNGNDKFTIIGKDSLCLNSRGQIPKYKYYPMVPDRCREQCDRTETCYGFSANKTGNNCMHWLEEVFPGGEYVEGLDCVRKVRSGGQGGKGSAPTKTAFETTSHYPTTNSPSYRRETSTEPAETETTSAEPAETTESFQDADKKIITTTSRGPDSDESIGAYEVMFGKTESGGLIAARILILW